MNPLGSRVSHFYQKTLTPTTVPIIIDNKLFLLTEQLTRHVVDTKLSFLIPHPQVNHGIWTLQPETPPTQPNIQFQPFQILSPNPMAGNVEQQLLLERMQAQYLMDMMNANANQQIINQSSWNDGLKSSQSPTVQDASTHTYDLLSSGDVNMTSVS